MNRPVALMDRAPDSKSGCWGFKSLLACHFVSTKFGLLYWSDAKKRFGQTDLELLKRDEGPEL
jgi:hypothetical protein